MEQLILAHIEVNEDNLLELAEQRAFTAQNWIISQGGIASDRVFIVRVNPEETDNKKPSSQARFFLSNLFISDRHHDYDQHQPQ